VPSLLRLSSAVSGGADGSVQRRRAERNQSASEKLGGLATRPRRLQLYTMIGRCAVTSSAGLAPDAPAESDASMVDTAKTSFRTMHGHPRPCGFALANRRLALFCLSTPHNSLLSDISVTVKNKEKSVSQGRWREP
jgi:hypothetical protein